MDYLFLINPVAGSGLGARIADEIEGGVQCPSFSIQTVFTDPKRIENQVLSLTGSKKLIVIAGGDGTVSTVTRILSKLVNPPPFAILPLGTGNDIARSLGWWDVWDTGGLPLFFTALANGRVEPIDVWSLGHGDTFLGYMGIGLDASIVRSFDKMRRYFKNSAAPSIRQNKLFYLLAGIKSIIRNTVKGSIPELDISLTDHTGKKDSFTLKGNFSFILSNIEYYAGGGRLSKGADRSDGILNIYKLDDMCEYIKFLAKGRFAPLSAQIRPITAKLINIAVKTPVQIQLDGEWAGEKRPGDVISVELARVIAAFLPPKDFFA
ncbi:MAG: diacylglycerol/lipid kinase family protein, partial [Dissulfurimicrobium sp.]